MSPSHHSRRGFTSEAGQATVNWLAMMIGVIALTAALAAAMPSVAPTIACKFQTLISKVSGGAIPECNFTAAVDDDVPDPSTCIVSERAGEGGASVTVLSVKGGAKVKITIRQTADKKVTVTVEGGPEIGLEFGPPASAGVSLDTGSTETTKGGSAKGGVKLNGNGSLTWEFDSPEKAREFADIVANKARDAAIDSTGVGGLARRFVGYGEDRPIPAPTIFGLEGGAKLFGEAEGGGGGLSGKAEGEIGPSIGGRYNSRTKETTVYYKLSASGKLSGQLLKKLGGRALGEGEVQIAVTFNSSGKPTNLTAIASGTVNGQLTGDVKGLSGKKGVFGKRADIRLDLNLKDPANQAAFDEFTRNPFSGASGLAERLTDDAQIGARFYDASQTDVGVKANGSIFDVAFGAELGGAYKTADVESAYYYDRETGSWKPWVECKK